MIPVPNATVAGKASGMLDADVKVMTSVGVGVGVGGLGGVCMSGLVASWNFSGIERNDGILYLTNETYRKSMNKNTVNVSFHPVQYAK